MEEPDNDDGEDSSKENRRTWNVELKGRKAKVRDELKVT